MKALTRLLLLTLPFSASAADGDIDLNALPADKLGSYVSAFEQKQQDLWIEVSGQRYPIRLATIKEGALVATYEKGIVFIAFDFEDDSGPGKEVTVAEGKFEGNLARPDTLDQAERIWTSSAVAIDSSGEEFRYSGTLNSEGKPHTPFQLNINDSLLNSGTSQLVFNGNEAVLTGLLGSNTYVQLRDMVKAHPEVDTVVIKAVRGSLNDDINMHTGNLLRNAGLNTRIPADGFAYSGGVDLFTAGVKRTVEPGGKVGVHSWCCSADGKTAEQLPEDSPAHHDQLVYFSKMLGEKAGPEFYFYTIHAAPFDGMHKMSQEELKQYSLVH